MGISATNSALGAIQSGLKGLDRDTAEIARTTAKGDTMAVAEPLVNSLQHRNQIDVGAEVVKATDEMLGTLIDELA